MPYIREKQIAMEAVTHAARLCEAVRAELVATAAFEKGDKSPVTIADFGSQALICRYLTEAFPSDAIVAEEDAADLPRLEQIDALNQITRYVQQLHPTATTQVVYDWIAASGNRLADRYWTIDPLDGTASFIQNDQYAIALALIEDGDVKVGALACPTLPIDLHDPLSETGVLFVAVQGEGAHMVVLSNGTARRIHVTEAALGAELRFVENVEPRHGDQPLQASIARALGIVQPPLRVRSQAKYGIVARGDADLYFRLPAPTSPDYREKVWDHAAGALIVEEAGGRVTDMYGRRLDFATSPEMINNRGLVVTNGTTHGTVIGALAQSVSGPTRKNTEYSV